jgi:hypothetical protein
MNCGGTKQSDSGKDEETNGDVEPHSGTTSESGGKQTDADTFSAALIEAGVSTGRRQLEPKSIVTA